LGSVADKSAALFIGSIFLESNKDRAKRRVFGTPIGEFGKNFRKPAIVPKTVRFLVRH
jgi:hypothetical protein